VLSDFDPDGEEIAHSFARSLRDDFDVRPTQIEAIKVALTAYQVSELDLQPIMTAKQSSSNYDRFVEVHGRDVYELEAVRPSDLQRILKQAIQCVIDLEAFDAEIEAEKADALFLEAKRTAFFEFLESDRLTEGGD
jgi:hypothetical protein